MDKDLLRRKFILKRKSLNSVVVDIKSERIFENFITCNFKKLIKKVLVYFPINNEVDTKILIEYFNKNKIDIFMPAFKNEKWVISRFVNEDELIDGPFGTKQPTRLSVISVGDLDLAIVPGVAFSREGFRLGYGKGVCDKLLKNFCGIKVGFAYDFQVANNFLPEGHDVKMDYVITESRIIEASFPYK